MIEIKETGDQKDISNVINTVANASSSIQMMTVCNNELMYICIVDNHLNNHRVAVVKHDADVFTLSLSFRYNKYLPVVSNLYNGNAIGDSTSGSRAKALSVYRKMVGQIILETQDASGVHFCATKVLNHTKRDTFIKILKIGADIIKKVVDVADVTNNMYYQMPDNEPDVTLGTVAFNLDIDNKAFMTYLERMKFENKGPVYAKMSDDEKEYAAGVQRRIAIAQAYAKTCGFEHVRLSETPDKMGMRPLRDDYTEN